MRKYAAGHNAGHNGRTLLNRRTAVNVEHKHGIGHGTYLVKAYRVKTVVKAYRVKTTMKTILQHWRGWGAVIIFDDFRKF